jgi:hypothetical protein
MRVCMCVSVYVFNYICMHMYNNLRCDSDWTICMYVCMYNTMCEFQDAANRVCLRFCACMYVYMNVRMYNTMGSRKCCLEIRLLCLCVCVYVCMYVCLCSSTALILACMHLHMYICMYIVQLSC